jgi:hypothetical protein
MLRDDNDDQYSNSELVKYNKMIEDSKKPFYHGCAVQYTKLFAMVNFFQLKMSNRWSDCSFKDLLTVDILYAAPQAHRIINVALHRVYSPGIIFIFSQARKDFYHV